MITIDDDTTIEIKTQEPEYKEYLLLAKTYQVGDYTVVVYEEVENNGC